MRLKPTLEAAPVFPYTLPMCAFTVARWEAGEKSGEMALRLMGEVRRLWSGLSRVMKKDRIANWLSIPNPVFDGLKPLEVIGRGESDRIGRMIYNLEAGEPF